MSDRDQSRAIAARRLAHPPEHVRPGFAKLAGAELIERFGCELRSKGADVVDLEDIGELPRAVDAVLAARNLSRAELAISKDAALAAVFQGARDEAVPSRAALTAAYAGVAETGTLVLASGPQNPTSFVFLPDVHLVAVARDRLYACYEDALAAFLRERGTFPRAVNLVSGPSRTGDIGGRIVLGAHGPRHLAVFVYGSGQEKCP